MRAPGSLEPAAREVEVGPQAALAVEIDVEICQIDGGLLVLFIGLFIVIHGVERAGLDAVFFGYLRPIGIETVAGLSAVAAILSNLVSNVPAVMLFTRLVPKLPDPTTAWLALAMASTVAGNLTILGSIANLIVVEGAARHGVRIGFGEYLRVGLPVTLLTLAFGVWWLTAGGIR